jgi:hypothetical protein
MTALRRPVPGPLTAAVCVAAALVLAGCAPPSRPAPVASGIRWELDVSPYRPAALQAATLRLRAFDAAGRPIALQGFRATASMPEMDHRGETIAFREMDAGVYEALHTFSMDGRWEIHISGSVKGKRAEARIPLEVGAR